MLSLPNSSHIFITGIYYTFPAGAAGGGSQGYRFFAEYHFLLYFLDVLSKGDGRAWYGITTSLREVRIIPRSCTIGEGDERGIRSSVDVGYRSGLGTDSG